MKKIIIGVAGAAIAYTATSWYVGYAGEKQMRAQIELSKDYAETSGMSYELVSYQRGLFSSHFELKIKPLQTMPPFDKLEVLADGTNYHGPILWHGGLGLGLFDELLKPQLKLGDEEAEKKLHQAVGDSLGVVTMRAHFNKTYDASWDFQPISINEDGAQFSMAASSMKFTGRLDSLDCKGALAVGAIDVTSTDKSQVHIDSLAGNLDFKMLEPGILIGNYDLGVEQAKFTNAMGVAVDLSKLGLNMAQSVSDNALDTSVKLSLGKVSGPVEITNGYYEVKINKVSLDAVRSWSKAYRDAMASVTAGSDPMAAQLAMMGLFGSELPKFLQKGLNLHVNLGAEFMGGKPNAHWEINYVGPQAGKQLSDLTSTQEYLALVDSDLVVQAPAMLLGALPVQPYLGSYIVAEGDDYVLKAGLHQGALKVGTVDIPQEQLLAMAGAFVGSFQNAIAAQGAAAANQPADDANAGMSAGEGAEESTGEGVGESYEAEDGEAPSADAEE